MTSPETVADLVGGLRNDGPDASSAEMLADRARREDAVRKHDCRSGSRPPKSASRNPDPGHDRLECRRVTSLARGDVQSIFDDEWSLLGAAHGAFTAVPYLDPLAHDPRDTGPYLPLDREWWPP